MNEADIGQPIETAPAKDAFLVWHANEWRVVRRFNIAFRRGDIVVDPQNGRIWSARAWWPLPSNQTTNEGQPAVKFGGNDERG